MISDVIFSQSFIFDAFFLRFIVTEINDLIATNLNARMIHWHYFVVSKIEFMLRQICCCMSRFGVIILLLSFSREERQTWIERVQFTWICKYLLYSMVAGPY